MRKLTTAAFKQRIKTLVGNEYTVLGQYQGANIPILMRHNKCGYQWKVSPSAFINNGTRCPKCSTKRAADKERKTNAQFIKELHDSVGNEYTPLEPYKNARTPILMRHNKCGYTWKVSPSDFINQGHRCPKCSAKRTADKKRKTNDQFLKELYDRVGNEYTPLEKYQDAKTPILMKHNKCGYKWKISPNNFLRGSRCPKCSAKCAADKKRKTNTQFLKELHDIVGDEYTALESYKNNRTPILMKHNKCGYEWYVRPDDFINSNTRCPKCAGKMRKSNASFLKEVRDHVGDEYTPLEPYQGAKTPILMKHNKCGYEWRVRPDAFINKGRRCPRCNQYHGELYIEHYLRKHNISYEIQKRFADLRDERQLSYDFFVNGKVLIEYQGIQHYQARDYFGGQATFVTQQRHDRLKAQYAKQRGYVLLAIPYTVDTQTNVNKYLNKHLPCMRN